MPLNNKYLGIVGIVTLLFLAISTISWFVIGQITLVFCLVLMLGLLTAIQLTIYQKNQESSQKLSQNLSQHFNQESTNNYKQIEALFSVYSVLNNSQPLPPMRGWAISPDFANLVINLISEKKPQVIVELGSGVSTIISAYCLKSIGSGKIISIDQDKKYAEITNQNLAKHGLQDVAQVHYAPLKEVEINNKKWLWYDNARLKEINNIDILIVDGPKQAGQQEKLVRYPALPILFEYLSNNPLIILDDADREDERKIAQLWIKEFNSFKMENISTEKGTTILSKS